MRQPRLASSLITAGKNANFKEIPRRIRLSIVEHANDDAGQIARGTTPYGMMRVALFNKLTGENRMKKSLFLLLAGSAIGLASGASGLNSLGPSKCGAAEIVATDTESIGDEKETWKGSASADCECSDGTCKVITCEVDGKLSYEAAKSALQTSIEAKARSEKGKIKGSISFSISKTL